MHKLPWIHINFGTKCTSYHNSKRAVYSFGQQANEYVVIIYGAWGITARNSKVAILCIMLLRTEIKILAACLKGSNIMQISEFDLNLPPIELASSNSA